MRDQAVHLNGIERRSASGQIGDAGLCDHDLAFHGANWPNVHARYRARLGEVTSDVELQRLIEQMLSELNSSHVYVYRTVPGRLF
jgi:hypothetical protein